jgi:anaerobic magnesium-protoporphyrin IX monomethyl ester cyclase
MGWIPEIDLGVVGEAFVTFPEVLKKIDAHKQQRLPLDFKHTLGVIYRKPD